MRIAFYANHPYWGGLANNGGSRTIVRSAKALRTIGHHVDIVACKDRYTWEKHPKCVRHIPADADLVIAVSVSDIKHMLKRVPKRAKLGYWARPAEFWHMSSGDCLHSIGLLYKAGGHMICNSGWQTAYWHKKGVSCDTVFAGLDFEEWMNRRPVESILKFVASRRKKPVVGFLVHEAERKRFGDIKALVKALGDKCVCLALGEKMTVHHRIRKWLKRNKELVRYVESPSHEVLNHFYECCDFFVSASSYEGFHNCPSEAALCGAQVVVMEHSRNGCSDYCTPETACLCHSIEDAASQILAGRDEKKVQAMTARLRSHIGTRAKNMNRLVEVLA